MTFQKWKWTNLRFEEFFPVTREQNISESVNFEQISVNIVPPQSSHWEVPVVLQVCNLLRVAEVDQSRLRQLEAEIFILKARKVKYKIVNCFAGQNQPPRHYTRPGCNPYRTHRTWSCPAWGSDWQKSWKIIICSVMCWCCVQNLIELVVKVVTLLQIFINYLNT